jgi:hypothetical protein
MHALRSQPIPAPLAALAATLLPLLNSPAVGSYPLLRVLCIAAELGLYSVLAGCTGHTTVGVAPRPAPAGDGTAHLPAAPCCSARRGRAAEGARPAYAAVSSRRFRFSPSSFMCRRTASNSRRLSHAPIGPVRMWSSAVKRTPSPSGS